MNIGNTLAILFSTFGLAFVALLAPQVQSSYQYYVDSSDQILVDQARNDVFEAVLAVRQGRAALMLLAQQGAGATDPSQSLSAAIDFLDRAAETIAGSENAVLQSLSEPLQQQRLRLSAVMAEMTALMASGAPADIAATVAVQDGVLSDVQRETLLVRQQILQEIGIPDTTMGALQAIRTYILAVSNMLNNDLVLVTTAGPSSDALPDRQILTNVDRLIAINRFFDDVIHAYRNETTAVANDLFSHLGATYLPNLHAYAAAIDDDGAVVSAREDWLAAKHDADALIDQTTAKLFEMSQAHLVSENTSARAQLHDLLAWTIFATLMFVLSIYLVGQHIVRPLIYVQRKINDIASGRLDPITKKRLLLRDIDTVIDALRALRISARRRERLTAERLALSEQIVEAHRTLRSEFDAAAEVQLSLLPSPEDVGHIRFSTLFQPSRVVAGDTYDYTGLSDTRVGLFQIDVAGHGAAAGLVSMAAHISARRALRSIKPGIDLATAVRTLNTHWSPELTYFTATLVEFDATTQTVRLVQAGHPHPVLISKDGSVVSIGKAGLPIGVLTDAEFDMVEIPFNHGDRLLVFSDGIYENFNADGDIYAQERLIQLLRENAACSTDDLVEIVKESVVSWNPTGTPSDDVSLVIAERI